jgi:nucleoside-diphosphate-sugar epimerase
MTFYKFGKHTQSQESTRAMPSSPERFVPPTLVAVTGANGFIGSHVVARLLEDGFRVRAVVRDASDGAKVGHLLAMPSSDPTSLTLASCGDMLAPGAFDAAFAGCDAVVHTAAVVEVLSARDAENAIVRPAVTGTRNVLDAARKSGSVRRVVVTSSVAAVQVPLGLPDEHVYTEADWNTWSSARLPRTSCARALARTRCTRIAPRAPPRSTAR